MWQVKCKLAIRISVQFISEGDGRQGWIKFQQENVKILVGTQESPYMTSINATLSKIAYIAWNHNNNASNTKQAISWCTEKTNSLDKKLLPC